MMIGFIVFSVLQVPHGSLGDKKYIDCHRSEYRGPIFERNYVKVGNRCGP